MLTLEDGNNATAVPAAAAFLFIGELAKKTGTDPKTIRFYEREDLLSPPRHGRFRTYLASDVQRLNTVLTMRRMGLPIAQIRVLLNAAGGEADVLTGATAAAVLSAHLETLKTRQLEITGQISRTSSLVDRLTAPSA